jgi:hypothetical protein
MSRAVGCLLILAGVGVASTLLPGGSDADPAMHLPDLLAGWSAGPASTAPAVARVDKPAPAVAPQDAAPPDAARAQSKPQAASLAQPALSAPIVITVPARSESAPRVPTIIIGPGSDPGALARDLQRELRRVGCYGGEVSGVWTAASRRAMKAFTDRVNAALPVDAPDPILLSLVRAHQGDACGRQCPARETLAEDGRCVPTAVLAHAARKGVPPSEPVSASGRDAARRTAPAISGWTTSVTAAPSPAALPPPGRMALAGPQPESARPDTSGDGAAAPMPPGRKAKAKAARSAKVRAGIQNRRRPPRIYAQRGLFTEMFVRNFFWN